MHLKQNSPFTCKWFNFALHYVIFGSFLSLLQCILTIKSYIRKLTRFLSLLAGNALNLANAGSGSNCTSQAPYSLLATPLGTIYQARILLKALTD